jgi:membrane protease YdiL (CAAX protease family)
LYCIYIGAAISIGIFGSIICSLVHLKHDEIKLTPLMTILAGIILAPIYEEIIFRSLLKFKINNIILFIATFILFIVYFVFRSKIELVIIFSILLFTLLSLLIIYSRSKIELFLSSKFKYFFYATVLIFGLVHASNFTGNTYLILAFSLILGGPQIVLGFILGYIRMNYGLIYSILFHMFVNTSILLSLFHK